MLKTLNTITSLISNEGVTSAVTNSLQALARSLEAQVDRACDDFARMLESRLQSERHRYEQVIVTGRDQVKRVDDALDALRMRGAGELSAVERLDRVVGAVRTDVTDMRRATNEFSARLDRLEAAGPTDEQPRQDTVEYLEAVLTELKDDWVATLRGIEARLDKLEAQAASPCEGLRELIGWQSWADAALRKDTDRVLGVLKRLSALEDAVYNPDSTPVTPRAERIARLDAGREVVERIEALETQAGEVRNAFGRRLAALESQVAVLVSQSAAPCEGVNELRDQIEDVAVRAEMRFKSFDNVWQDLARSVSALAGKVESK